MAPQHSVKSAELDELLTLLADQYCRSIIFHFKNISDEVATISDLARELQIQESEKEIGVQLHHITLPRLEEADIIEYDARSRTVRYQGHCASQTLLEDIEGLYQTAEA